MISYASFKRVSRFTYLSYIGFAPSVSARRGRVYLPQDELAQAGLSDEDIFAGRVTDKWRNFMKMQLKRARMFFDEAEKGVTELSAASRWPVSVYKTLSRKFTVYLFVLDLFQPEDLAAMFQVWASLLLYRRILDEIEANDYNNFTKRAYVGKVKKIAALPLAYAKSVLKTSSSRLSI